MAGLILSPLPWFGMLEVGYFEANPFLRPNCFHHCEVKHLPDVEKLSTLPVEARILVAGF
jgi:hypothetical protein